MKSGQNLQVLPLRVNLFCLIKVLRFYSDISLRCRAGKYNLSRGDYNNRKGRGSVPFNDYRKTIFKPIIGYNNSPTSLGDKIRNKRLELKLLQKEVADVIGVSEDAVTYWENNKAQPQVHHYPKVIEFLGYFPFDIDISTSGGRIMEYRFRNGLSQKMLGKRLEVDGATICAWERNENIPLERHMEKLLELFQ